MGRNGYPKKPFDAFSEGGRGRLNFKYACNEEFFGCEGVIWLCCCFGETSTVFKAYGVKVITPIHVSC